MRRWGAERQQDFKIMEDHLYTCIYDIKTRHPPDKKLAAMNRYRAKLVRLQARRTEHVLLDSSERDMIDREETTLYDLIKQRKDEKREQSDGLNISKEGLLKIPHK
jgi:hypothetical protein